MKKIYEKNIWEKPSKWKIIIKLIKEILTLKIINKTL